MDSYRRPSRDSRDLYNPFVLPPWPGYIRPFYTFEKKAASRFSSYPEMVLFILKLPIILFPVLVLFVAGSFELRFHFPPILRFFRSGPVVMLCLVFPYSVLH